MLLCQQKGWDRGGGWVSTLGPGNMAASGHSCRKPLVSTGWAIPLLLCTNGLRKRPSGHVCRACISGSEGSVGATIGQEPIASSLDSGWGLSLKCVQLGCNGTCVKLNRNHDAYCPIKTRSHGSKTFSQRGVEITKEPL